MFLLSHLLVTKHSEISSKWAVQTSEWTMHDAKWLCTHRKWIRLQLAITSVMGLYTWWLYVWCGDLYGPHFSFFTYSILVYWQITMVLARFLFECGLKMAMGNNTYTWKFLLRRNIISRSLLEVETTTKRLLTSLSFCYLYL